MFDGFWDNISRYSRYFITISLGVLLNSFAPLLPLLKNPLTLAAVVGFLIGGMFFLTLTLRAMFGLSTI
jgi:hypothetical protein